MHGTSVQIYDDSDIFSRRFLHFYEEFYQIFCSSLRVLIAGRWKNFSFSSYIYEDFSMGQRSPTDLSSRDFFSSIYASFLLFKRVPISLKILKDCDTNFLSVLPVMNIIMYFFWGIVIIQSSFVYFLSLNLQMLYLFKELIQRVSSSHSFIMILISFCCYLWSSVFENKELKLSCNKIVYLNRFAIGSRIQVNACLYW